MINRCTGVAAGGFSVFRVSAGRNPVNAVVRQGNSCMWQPISKAELWTEINHAVREMTLEQRRLWAIISVSPSKWMLPPWGDMGAGFWVVAFDR
jgi:hypothetical protein